MSNGLRLICEVAEPIWKECLREAAVAACERVGETVGEIVADRIRDAAGDDEGVAVARPVDEENGES